MDSSREYSIEKAHRTQTLEFETLEKLAKLDDIILNETVKPNNY